MHSLLVCTLNQPVIVLVSCCNQATMLYMTMETEISLFSIIIFPLFAFNISERTNVQSIIKNLYYVGTCYILDVAYYLLFT